MRQMVILWFDNGMSTLWLSVLWWTSHNTYQCRYCQDRKVEPKKGRQSASTSRAATVDGLDSKGQFLVPKSLDFLATRMGAVIVVRYVVFDLYVEWSRVRRKFSISNFWGSSSDIQESLQWRPVHDVLCDDVSFLDVCSALFPAWIAVFSAWSRVFELRFQEAFESGHDG